MKKLLKVLLTLMTLSVVLVGGTVFAHAVGPEGYNGFNELIKILKDILKILGGFMAVIAVIYFSYSIVSDRPEGKLTAVKLLAGGAMLFMLALGIDKFF